MHWKVDCPRIKDKNKELKAEANLTQVINIQSSSISQVDGSDSDSSIFSFSVTTPTIGCSGDSEEMLDTRGTYHVCPNKDYFSSFKKLDGYFVVIGDDRLCYVEGIGLTYIKIFDGIVRELKDVRYVS